MTTYFYADTQDDIEAWVDENPISEALQVWQDAQHYLYFEPTTGIRGYLNQEEYAVARGKGLTI